MKVAGLPFCGVTSGAFLVFGGRICRVAEVVNDVERMAGIGEKAECRIEGFDRHLQQTW
jgi:hypothetical protein